MANPIKKVSSADSLVMISNIILAAFVICALYFGREVLVPLALAALLTFMFAPLVTRLQRWLGRVAPVLIVVGMIFASTGLIGWVLMRQGVDLANQFPSYEENIRTKLHSIQLPTGGPLSKVSQTLEDLKADLPGSDQEKTGKETTSVKGTNGKVMPVRIVSDKDQRIEFAQIFLAPILGPLGTAGLVMLLLVFMLLQRDDLRIRLVRLLGQSRISLTTSAMDEVGSRVSKYLVMQMIVNVTYGIPVAVGLYFIGVPNALLWGALATVLRFIPYVGPWIAAAFPILLSLAVSPTWLAPILTISLFVVLELFSNNVMEPWLYGSSTGVTPIALIVAALVWTWLWGPVGLVLSTPLTVCLVVMGRLVPRLSFLSVLLSDEEPLTPAEELYHRLHSAGDHDEMELVYSFLKTNTSSSLFDKMLIPVITAAEKDYRSGVLDSEQHSSIEQGVHRIVEELNMKWEASLPESGLTSQDGMRVCCLPARAYRDQLAGEMISQLLNQQGYQAQNASSKMVSGELVEWVQNSNINVVCISAVKPTTVVHALYLCAKLRKKLPTLRIVVGLWGFKDSIVDAENALREAGADDVVTNVSDALTRVNCYGSAARAMAGLVEEPSDRTAAVQLA